MSKFESFEEQMEFLQTVQSKGIKLSDALEQRGLTYDNLVYEDKAEIDELTSSEFIPIDQLPNDKASVECVSFFSGAGGFDIGFEKAGFQSLACIEYEEIFCDTLRLNFPDTLVIGPPEFEGNIKKFDEVKSILENECKLTIPFEGVFFGGPPCQPFSIAANQRFNKNGDNFKRTGFNNEDLGNLLEDYVKYIIHFQPKVFVIENVTGLVDIDNGVGLSHQLLKLEKEGYKVDSPRKVNMADYGIPQNRNRVFIIGYRDHDKKFGFIDQVDKKVACIEALNYSQLSECNNHDTRKHNVGSVLRYCKLGPGKRDKLGRVDRLNPNLPSKTIIAGGKKGGGRSHLHPMFPRTLSVRESARLQTFPDDYIFTGSTARQFTQVGNAVPPLFAYKLAKEIMIQIFQNNSKQYSLSDKGQLQLVMEK